MIGLVPQELHTDAFETVSATVTFSRGRSASRAIRLRRVLKALADEQKGRQDHDALGRHEWQVLIAKALAPKILFLDSPAGVDVRLRQDMWRNVQALRASGVTIILTTHYIEEAEEMADRIGVINHGELILVEDKAELMRKLGHKQLTLHLQQKLEVIPPELGMYSLSLTDGGRALVYNYDTQGERTGITGLLQDLRQAGIRFRDLETSQSSLEDIFVDVLRQR